MKPVGFVLSFVIGLSSLPAVVKSDCGACWSLRGVSIQLANGSTVRGYVPWNDSWARVSPDSVFPFPEAIFRSWWDGQQVIIYASLQRVKYPVEGLVVATAAPVELNPDSLKSVALRRDTLDGYGGAGRLPLVTNRTAELLMTTPPMASCRGECGLSDVFWLSYNADIGEEDLAPLCKEPWLCKIPWNPTLEANRVIRLEYAWD